MSKIIKKALEKDITTQDKESEEFDKFFHSILDRCVIMQYNLKSGNDLINELDIKIAKLFYDVWVDGCIDI